MTHFHHLHPLAVLMPFFVVLFRSAIAAQMLLWYNVPIPGLGVSFPQLFPDIAQKITNAIDYHALAQVIDEINKVLAMPATSLLGHLRRHRLLRHFGGDDDGAIGDDDQSTA